MGKIKERVKKEYASLAKSGGSCCPDYSCCDIGYDLDQIKSLPKAVTNFSLGCGNPVALADIQEGEVVLDIGSGGGLDVFLASKKVGETGKVIGVDMTAEMIEKARANARKMDVTNVEFKLGDAEVIPVESSSVDLVMSNCVINLSPDKERVFKEASRVLKRAGRFVVSDIVTKGELPGKVRRDPRLLVNCVAGALSEEKYIAAIKKAGFKTVEIVKKSSMSISGVEVISETIRARKE